MTWVAWQEIDRPQVNFMSFIAEKINLYDFNAPVIFYHHF